MNALTRVGRVICDMERIKSDARTHRTLKALRAKSMKKRRPASRQRWEYARVLASLCTRQLARRTVKGDYDRRHHERGSIRKQKQEYENSRPRAHRAHRKQGSKPP